MDYLEMVKISIPLLAIGGAWGAAKVALNGTRDKVYDLEKKQDDHADRLARIETKIDYIVEKV